MLSALLISKTHDDFSYYHLPFTKYLTEQKIIFGMGNLGHGYKLISSLFFLNSTFYLPFLEYFSKSLLVGVFLSKDLFSPFITQSLLFLSFLIATFLPAIILKIKFR